MKSKCTSWKFLRKKNAKKMKMRKWEIKILTQTKNSNKNVKKIFHINKIKHYLSHGKALIESKNLSFEFNPNALELSSTATNKL